MTRPTVIHIMCDGKVSRRAGENAKPHAKPHRVADFTDDPLGMNCEMVRVDGKLTAVHKWREMEPITAAIARHLALPPAPSPESSEDAFGAARRPPVEAYRPSQLWHGGVWQQELAGDNEIRHRNACTQCGTSVPIPDDRMQVLLEGFANLGRSVVWLPQLDDADKRRPRAAMDTE